MAAHLSLKAWLRTPFHKGGFGATLKSHFFDSLERTERPLCPLSFCGCHLKVDKKVDNARRFAKTELPKWILELYRHQTYGTMILEKYLCKQLDKP